MIELKENRPDPTELARFRKSDPGSKWDNPEFSTVKTSIRHQLNQEQEELCVYCEGKLDKDDGHIDHIKPRAIEPNLTFTYDNMAHSCGSKVHCGRYKSNNKLPVEPRTGCNRFFTMSMLDGVLKPALGIAEDISRRALDTIKILGLNAPSLARQRKNYIETIIYLDGLLNPSDVREFIANNPYRWTLGGLF